MNARNVNNTPQKQRGATLFTALVFLALMTIVSVSATKISILDVLVAGNNQQQMRLAQETENDLKLLARVIQLYPPINPDDSAIFDDVTGIYNLPGDPSRPNVDKQIADPKKRYSCSGFDGKAVTIGPDASPCDLYDFQVKSGKLNSGVRDRHNRGAGKEKPNPNKNSYL